MKDYEEEFLRTVRLKLRQSKAMPTEKEEFGSRLGYFLELRGKNQTDLQELLGVSSATTSDWCNGKKFMKLEHLRATCRFLGITATELLGF